MNVPNNRSRNGRENWLLHLGFACRPPCAPGEAGRLQVRVKTCHFCAWDGIEGIFRSLESMNYLYVNRVPELQIIHVN